jgi:hypothetical protein
MPTPKTDMERFWDEATLVDNGNEGGSAATVAATTTPRPLPPDAFVKLCVTTPLATTSSHTSERCWTSSWGSIPQSSAFDFPETPTPVAASAAPELDGALFDRTACSSSTAAYTCPTVAVDAGVPAETKVGSHKSRRHAREQQQLWSQCFYFTNVNMNMKMPIPCLMIARHQQMFEVGPFGRACYSSCVVLLLLFCAVFRHDAREAGIWV